MIPLRRRDGALRRQDKELPEDPAPHMVLPHSTVEGPASGELDFFTAFLPNVLEHAGDGARVRGGVHVLIVRRASR